MKRHLTWLSDAERARIEPLLSHGRKGAHRVDDPACDLGHRAYAQERCTLARLSARMRPQHDRLQPLQSLEPARASGWAGSDRTQRRLGSGRHRRHLCRGCVVAANGDAATGSGEACESRPLVTRRHLTVRHRAFFSIACAVIDFASGICRWRGRPRPATGKTIATSAR